MARKDYIRVELRMSAALFARLERWREGLVVETSRSADACVLLDRALSEVEAAAVPPAKRPER